MSLSADERKALKVALGAHQNSDNVGDRIADAIDAMGSGPASHVANIEPTVDMPASNVTLSTSNTYSDAAVKTAIDGGVNALRVSAEARLDAIEAKIDSILSALQGAGLMS